MPVDNLIRMANQIGDFFEAMPDHGEALQGIATHIKKFWDPRMRRELLQHLDVGGTDGLHAMVEEAIRTHRSLLG